MPQIIMLQHAAWVEKHRMDERVRRNRASGDAPFHDQIADSMPTWNGKPIDKLTSSEYLAYHASAMI
jgi:hypothetical protein